MTITEYNDHLTRLTTVDKQAILGSVVWFTVGGLAVPYDKVKAQLEAAGLADVLPKNPPCDADVFRRTFQNGRRRRTETGPNTVENLLVTEVAKRYTESGVLEEIVKRIVVEDVDAEGERLNYQEAVEVRFSAITGGLTIRSLADGGPGLPDSPPRVTGLNVTDEPSEAQAMLAELKDVLASLSPEPVSEPEPVEDVVEVLRINGVDTALVPGTYSPRALQLVRDLERAYYAERGCLDGAGVRNVIKATLAACSATQIREGGAVYFVASEYDDKLAALEQVASLVAGTFVHTLPLVDDAKQRVMVRDAFKAEATTDVEKCIIDAMDALRSGDAITARKFQALQTRYLALKAKTDEYKEILNDELDTSEFRLDVLKAHMTSLFQRAD